MTDDSYYLFWVSRDLNGTLRIWSEEPVWTETMWQYPMADITVRNVGLRWVRKLPPTLFPNLRPGGKRRIRVG